MSNKNDGQTDLTAKQQSYVEVIAELQSEHDHAHVYRIAEELGISKPSVVQMLDRLLTLGVVQRQHHEVVLTEEGHQLANELNSRHSVLRNFMIEHLGMSKRAADADACRIEHVVSDTFVTRLRDLCSNQPAQG